MKKKKDLELYFESSDIETIIKRIKPKNVKIIHNLKEEPWGQRMLKFYDPDVLLSKLQNP